MKLLPASLALLGFEVAMAAALSSEDAQPTRPRAPVGLQEASRITQEAPAATEAIKQLEIEEEGLQLEQQQGQSLWFHQEAKRQDSMSAGAVTTEIGFFTVDGGVFSISSLAGGLNVVAGKTLTVGGPYGIVGGAAVSAAPSGVYADGTEIMFQTVTRSASMSMSSDVAGTSSMAAGGSESAGAASQSQSSPDAAMPKATAGAGVIVAVGAVVGALVL